LNIEKTKKHLSIQKLASDPISILLFEKPNVRIGILGLIGKVGLESTFLIP